MRPLRARLFVASLVLAFIALEVAARPGGGNSYSGGSSRSSGGSSSGRSGGSSSYGGSGSSRSSSSSSSSSRGSSGSSDNVGDVGPLYAFTGNSTVDHLIPPVFIMVLAIACFGIGKVLLSALEGATSRVDIGGHAPPLPRKPRLDIRDGVFEFVRKHDPNFSLVLFEDFAYTLYAESQRARHDPSALAGLAPYWSPDQQTALSQRPPKGGRVQAVVVGSLAPKIILESAGQLGLQYSFETNLHIRLAPGTKVAPVSPSFGERAVEVMKGLLDQVLQPEAQQSAVEQPPAVTQYVEEVWTFSRDATVKTRPWTGVRKLGCPSCGAPFRSTADARCESCGQDSGGGRFDWQVTSVNRRREETREHSLTGTAEEVGTDYLTCFAPRVKERRDELFRDDPAVTQASLEARLRLIYQTLQSAWTAQDLRPVRSFVSDRLYAYLQYWIDAYKEQGLRNLMGRPRFGSFAIARVERDAHYDAVTLRIWAAGFDYTIEEKSSRVVGGSRTQERVYSEYWTLVRSAKVRGAPRLEKSCPACGAPLEINMAGDCEHCSVHVTSGEFDWVLSKIEQDEAYRG